MESGVCVRMHVCVHVVSSGRENANEGERQAGEVTQREKVTKVSLYIRSQVFAVTATSRSQ